MVDQGVVGEMLALVDREIARVSAVRNAAPVADKLWYCYVADANGNVRLDQDYPFVCEKVAVTLRPSFGPLGAPTIGYTEYCRLRIEVLSNSHPLTLGQQATVAGGGVMVEAPSMPVYVFSPLDRLNFSAVAQLPVETEFPKGGALRALLEPVPFTAAWARVVLVGYKRIG